jgi:hypothetical protein
MTPNMIEDTPKIGRLRASTHRAVTALLEMLALYGIMGWLYVAVLATVRPHDLAYALTHWLPVRRDTFGTFCFAVSALAYLLLNARTGRGIVCWPCSQRPGR